GEVVRYGQLNNVVPLVSCSGGQELRVILSIPEFDTRDGIAQNQSGKTAVRYHDVAAAAENKHRDRPACRPPDAGQHLFGRMDLGKESGRASYLEGGQGRQAHLLAHYCLERGSIVVSSQSNHNLDRYLSPCQRLH